MVARPVRARGRRPRCRLVRWSARWVALASPLSRLPAPPQPADGASHRHRHLAVHAPNPLDERSHTWTSTRLVPQAATAGRSTSVFRTRPCPRPSSRRRVSSHWSAPSRSEPTRRTDSPRRSLHLAAPLPAPPSPDVRATDPQTAEDVFVRRGTSTRTSDDGNDLPRNAGRAHAARRPRRALRLALPAAHRALCLQRRLAAVDRLHRRVLGVLHAEQRRVLHGAGQRAALTTSAARTGTKGMLSPDAFGIACCL